MTTRANENVENLCVFLTHLTHFWVLCERHWVDKIQACDDDASVTYLCCIRPCCIMMRRIFREWGINKTYHVNTNNHTISLMELLRMLFWWMKWECARGGSTEADEVKSGRNCNAFIHVIHTMRERILQKTRYNSSQLTSYLLLEYFELSSHFTSPHCVASCLIRCRQYDEQISTPSQLKLWASHHNNMQYYTIQKLQKFHKSPMTMETVASTATRRITMAPRWKSEFIRPVESSENSANYWFMEQRRLVPLGLPSLDTDSNTNYTEELSDNET